MDHGDIGKRIRELRKSYGYSQRELAARAGLTHGAISFIERDKISPSVGNLRKILDAFSVTLSDFFSGEPISRGKVFFRKEDLVEVGGGGISLLQVGEDLHDRPLQILSEHYEVGAETASEPYSHQGYEGGIVISGSIEVTVGGETETLGPGDAYLFSSRIPHRFHNPGPDTAVVVSVNTPPI